MRYEVIEDEKIKSLIRMKDELVIDSQNKADEMKALDTELGKVLHKIKRLNDKVIQLVEPHKTFKLDEFEYYNGIGIRGEELHLEIVDRIEELKEAIRTQRKEETKK